jgi:two-component system cell cycle sensor histidine kinase/response regulator CckA
MESLGHLAGGIAHDFNNLLTVVLGAGELLAEGARDPATRELCDSIRAACARGRSMTQHLLAVASRQVVAPTRLDLPRTVRDLEPVLRSLLGEDVRLAIESADAPVHVRAALTQIEQIFINLAANARDAMPRGGEFAIRIGAGADAGAGAAVAIEVRDTGVGMTPEVLEHAFEPFFTTRRDRGGRGLGLATVYGIVKQLGGSVRLDSAPGRGTRVHITLPHPGAADPPSAGAAPAGATVGPPSAASPPAGITARVLLIEDEPDVRLVLQRLLQSLGCHVVAAADGAAAVACLAATPDRFDVVVSDVVMPGLYGTELVHALRRHRPRLPILFASGHADGRLSHHDLRAMGLEIVPKPPDLRQLAAALQRTLAARP